MAFLLGGIIPREGKIALRQYHACTTPLFGYLIVALSREMYAVEGVQNQGRKADGWQEKHRSRKAH